MLDHLIPAEYVQTMRKHMLNRCPVSSWADVQQTITEDLGAPPTELFARFSPEPLASASLAQVHEAETRDGTRLAVKVWSTVLSPCRLGWLGGCCIGITECFCVSAP